MTKFSTSGFVHPVYCLSHRAEKTRAERKKQQSERERESSTNGTDGKRTQRETLQSACVCWGKNRFQKFSKCNTTRIHTSYLKERARKGSRPKGKANKRDRNKRVPGEGVKFHKLRASPTFGPCSAIFFFSQETTTREVLCVDANEKKKTSASDLFRVFV